MGEKSRARHPAHDRTARCFRLYDLVATRTTQLRPNLPDHFEMFRNPFQHLGNIFTKGLQFTAAVGTSFLFRQNLVRLPWQMCRQRLPCMFCRSIHIRRGQRGWRSSQLLRAAGLQFIQPQLQLFDLPVQLLRLAPELHAPQLGDQQFQAVDLFVSRGHLLVFAKELLIFLKKLFVLCDDQGL